MAHTHKKRNDVASYSRFFFFNVPLSPVLHDKQKKKKKTEEKNKKKEK